MDKLGNILPKIVRRQPGGARLMGMQVATAFRQLMGPDVAGLCDEVIIHLAPYLLGGGVSLFAAMPDGIRLEKLSVSDGPFATHLRYSVVRK